MKHNNNHVHKMLTIKQSAFLKTSQFQTMEVFICRTKFKIFVGDIWWEIRPFESCELRFSCSPNFFLLS